MPRAVSRSAGSSSSCRDLARDPLVAGLGAEAPGQPAAPGEDLRRDDPRGGHEPGVRLGAQDRLVVAVRLDERLDRLAGRAAPSPRRRAAPRASSRGRRRPVPAGRRGGAPGGPPGATAAHDGSRTTIGSRAVADPGRVERAPQHVLRRVELAGGRPRQAAAHLAARERDVEARGREDPHRGVAHGRREVLGERVRPQDDLATVGLGRRRVGERRR